MRSYTRLRLALVTAAAMAIATLPFTVFSVLGSELIEEFSISRAQLGFLATATGLAGALGSPTFGRVTDRIGSVAATRGVLISGSLTLLGVSIAPSYAFLVLAAFATGVANGWTNPATNSLIVDTTSAGARGVVTGIKQSGVQVGTFLGGALMPVLALAWNWRLAAASFVIIPLLGLAGMWRRTAENRHEVSGSWGSDHLPRAVWWIAVYGTVSGLATSAMFVFIPLFANEDQGWSGQAAGLLIALVGLAGIGARILWSSLAERRLGHGPTLRVLGALSAVAASLLALTSLGALQSWVLVPAVLFFAFGSVAWNAVGMLAVMDMAPPHLVGKGTGIVLFGFLLGYAFGSPIMGFSVDSLGTYTVGWVAAAVLLGATVLIANRIPSGSTVAAK